LARRDEVARSGLDQYAAWLRQNQYGIYPPVYGNWGEKYERPEASFESYTYAAYKSDGIVFACMLARQLAFSEARFQFRQVRNGRPGNLFGTPGLELLERPWPNGTTGQLLTRMIQDVDLCGNAYIINEGDRLRRLRPDWVEIILSRPPQEASDVDVVGYRFWPGGIDVGEPEIFTVEEMCHWAPTPDPTALYRGMSWLTPVIREIQADQAASDHKLSFFRNGATLGPIFTLPKEMSADQFREFKRITEESHSGVENAYKTVFIGGGATVTLGAADFRAMDFKSVQGAGETRIAAAARIHPVLVGLSEGLAGSSLNSGNYAAAKRNFADGTLRPLWRDACGALATIIEVPDGAELWFDDRDIAYLREDASDIAEIQSRQASAIRQLLDAGYTADTTVQAILADDMSLLKHSGLFSVQLQPPGTTAPEPNPAPATGGQEEPT
jgi:phage portal protein BeeE